MRTDTIDLADLAAKRRDKIENLEASQEALVEQAKEKHGEYADTPASFEQKYDELESTKVELEAEAKALEALVDEHEDTAFEVQELSGGAVADIQDQILEKSFDFDLENQAADGVPKAGYGEVLWVRKSVVKAPDWLEDTEERGKVVYPNDPANLPWKAFEALSDAVDNWNTVGDVSLGNSSLQEAMESSD